MRLFLFIFALIALASCTGKSGSHTVYSGTPEAYQKFINQKDLADSSKNLTIDKSIVNNDYPIEIALYQDHKFFYDLPNLGTGTGTWKFKDGKIELKAKRSIFDMYIEVYGADKEISEAVILFSDRFGPNNLKMENHNI